MTDLVTMYAPQANSPVTTTTEAITAAQMSVSVLAGSIFPTAPMLLVLGGDTEYAETILVSSISGNTVTIAERAVEGTARAWPSGTPIARLFTAKDLRDVQNNIRTLNDYKADNAEVRLIGRASGDIASFPDGIADEALTSLICDINPVQAGSGDPSPTNIRAISGWTEVNVARTGKNLCPRLTGRTINGVTFTEQPDGSMTVVGTATAEALNAGASSAAILADYPLLPPGDYVIEGPPAARYYIQFRSKGNAYVSVQDLSTGNLIDRPSVRAGDTLRFRVTTPCCAYVRVDVITSDGAVNMTAYPQIEVGDTPSVYEPYQSSFYPISLGRTVYGGKLNVTAGELTETHGYIESYSGQTLPGKWIADRAVYAAGTTPPTGAQVVYELDEPLTYQLTPQEVTTLLGENNIWADCGPSTVSYGANTALREELEELVAKELNTKQDAITVSGIIKGDGEGGVSAAVAGTDYQAPLTAGTDYATPASIPTPSSSTPQMDGTGSAGSGEAYARADHVHPVDTSRQAKITAAGILKGDGNGGVSGATADEDYVTPAFLNNYVSGSEKGANNGVATLNANGKVTPSQVSARIVSISSNTTLSATHYGCLLSVTGSRTITIPAGLEVGTEIEILNYNSGTGTVTVKAASGVALNGTTAGSKTIDESYTSGVLKCVASNAWVIQGAIS